MTAARRPVDADEVPLGELPALLDELLRVLGYQITRDDARWGAPEYTIEKREGDVSAWLIALTGGIYLYVAGEQYVLGNQPLAIAYFGYALANVGLYLLAK